MLTGDENIVDIDFAVQWQINPAKAADFVFNIQAPEASVKAVAESAMREVIGRRNIQADPDHGPRPHRGRGAAGDAGHAQPLRRRRRDPPCAVAEGRSAAAGHRRVPRRPGGAAGPGPRPQRGGDLRRARSCPRREARPPASSRKRKPIANASSPRRTARRAASRRSTRNTARLPTSPASACTLETMERVLGGIRQDHPRPERLERAGRRALPAARRAATPSRAGSQK